MVYVDFNELMPIFKQHYKGIGAIFDNDTECIPGLVFFANSACIQELAQCFLRYASWGKNDMEVLAFFYHEKKSCLLYCKFNCFLL